VREAAAEQKLRAELEAARRKLGLLQRLGRAESARWGRCAGGAVLPRCVGMCRQPAARNVAQSSSIC
jgi:hypothetical protein